ncbi:helix-turn-helix transcriptional regulator, partial [Vibrio parahaemolyticus]
GASNQQIAEQLFVSENTVKTHLHNIFKKIDVKNRVQALIWAKENISDHSIEMV